MKRLGFSSSILGLALVGCAPSQDINADEEAQIPKSSVSAMHLAAWRESNPDWYQQVAPFRIIGDQDGGIYYVGTVGLGMFFIPTPEGHILIDGGMPDQGEMVANAVRQLGYDPADIAILLNTHAHMDHSGGLAELKAMSGATLIASAGDRSALEGGFYLGSESDESFFAPPVKVDRIIADGQTVIHGGVTLTAHMTPGHSRGCTSWMLDVQQGDQSFETLIFCSATVAANRLVGKPQYEGIVEDYRQTFDKTRDWQPDVFLANHPFFFDLKAKRERQQAGDPLAFVDNADFTRHITKVEGWFRAALKKQQVKAGR